MKNIKKIRGWGFLFQTRRDGFSFPHADLTSTGGKGFRSYPDPGLDYL